MKCIPIMLNITIDRTINWDYNNSTFTSSKYFWCTHFVFLWCAVLPPAFAEYRNSKNKWIRQNQKLFGSSAIVIQQRAKDSIWSQGQETQYTIVLKHKPRPRQQQRLSVCESHSNQPTTKNNWTRVEAWTCQGYQHLLAGRRGGGWETLSCTQEVLHRK